MKNHGIVRQLIGQEAVVEILPPSGGCGRCHEAGGCGSTLLNESPRPRRLNLYRLPNVIDAQPGESVVVEIPDELLLRAAGWSYLFPVLLILLGAELGRQLVASWLRWLAPGLGWHLPCWVCAGRLDIRPTAPPCRPCAVCMPASCPVIAPELLLSCDRVCPSIPLPCVFSLCPLQDMACP